MAAGAPGALGAAIFFLPIPYNILAFAGVWRSADHYGGQRMWAELARAAIVVWTLTISLV